ncbi:hypothetical protein DPMN_039624 [Dreissena polymorpha]|uniref:P2X purinoreceptor 7 intracellular domain-containing protein n=1 Tax=Dreissena polymorpha TaxID=45954 RepID=A0A9D4CV51_DREPO|nr:hypothetical protein DPMN_039624 [Dreissena polymorpha]
MLRNLVFHCLFADNGKETFQTTGHRFRFKSTEELRKTSCQKVDTLATITKWCSCHRCPQNERVEDRVCCGMVPELCSSHRPEMTLSVLDRMTLYSQQQYQQDVFSFYAETLEDMTPIDFQVTSVI